MNEDLAREIQREVQAFEHNTDTNRIRLTFTQYCGNIFSHFHVYDTNTDKEDKDKNCLFLMYTYLMMHVTSKSVMTSMVNKLEASGADYQTDVTEGFLKVQAFREETTVNWLYKIFDGNSDLICGAFHFDTTMWPGTNDKDISLMYIGAIDADLKEYIINFDCISTVQQTAKENFEHIQTVDHPTGGNQVAELDFWGQSFIVDFFLAYTVCPNGGVAVDGKWTNDIVIQYFSTLIYFNHKYTFFLV